MYIQRVRNIRDSRVVSFGKSYPFTIRLVTWILHLPILQLSNATQYSNGRLMPVRSVIFFLLELLRER
jgi:hypothetical protein